MALGLDSGVARFWLAQRLSEQLGQADGIGEEVPTQPGKSHCMIRRRLAGCYLCGEPATTREHIPPKSIFPGPRPLDLITVPACESCNRTASKDDEYFRWLVATAAADEPTAQAVVETKVLPQFRRRPALLQEIMKNAVWRAEVRSPGGIILGYKPGFRIDRPRVQRVVNRVVRGLFLRHAGRRLPSGYDVRRFVMNPRLNEEFKNQIVALPLRGTRDEVFEYRFSAAVEDPDTTIWFLMFYKRLLFMTMTERGEDG